MSIFVTRHQSLFALVLALLLATGCSDQGSTPASKTEAPESAAPEAAAPVMETTEVAAPKEEQAAAEASPAVAEQTAAVDGKKTYQTYCQACHATGAAGAPKLGDKAAWAPRIAKGNDTLFSSVTNGLNAMPPKGTCMSCSDDELHAAMEYMISQGS